MTPRQLETKAKIEEAAALFGIDPRWAVAVAMTESSLGEAQVSPTGCSGVFQMSKIAMFDLLVAMKAKDDDLIDIVCGVAFLRLLLKRWKTINEATLHFCDPKDRDFYLRRVRGYMERLE
jgi:membrane-bound lytic murein transglycosylase MltF